MHRKLPRASPTAHASLKEKIEQMENTVKVLNGTVLTLKMDADKVPQLLKLLVSRVAGLRLPSQVHDGSRNGGSSFFCFCLYLYITSLPYTVGSLNS